MFSNVEDVCPVIMMSRTRRFYRLVNDSIYSIDPEEHWAETLPNRCFFCVYDMAGKSFTQFVLPAIEQQQGKHCKSMSKDQLCPRPLESPLKVYYPMNHAHVSTRRKGSRGALGDVALQPGSAEGVQINTSFCSRGALLSSFPLENTLHDKQRIHITIAALFQVSATIASLYRCIWKFYSEQELAHTVLHKDSSQDV